MLKSILITLLSCVSFIASAQITIHDTDFPVAGDTVRYSTVSPATATIDLTLTGPNYLWDFSTLVTNGQSADTFVAVSSTGAIYSLYFTFVVSSNLAVRGSLPPVPGVGISDVYNFYKKNTAGLLQTGIGATLNGQQVPVQYTVKDTVYKFPLDYTDHDSSHSVFGISLTGLGSYNGSQTRINDVDGWGTVITPYGTFNCLRVVTQLTGHDSLYVDSLTAGFGFDRLLTREYKWIAAGYDGPVLQVNTQELLPGLETITDIFYRDVAHPASVSETKGLDNLLIYPNPANDMITLEGLSRSSKDMKLTIFGIDGKEMPIESSLMASNNGILKINTKNWESGTYLVKVENDFTKIYRKIVISR